MNTEKLWERFIFLMSIDSFGEQEVIMEGKRQKMFLGSIEKHKKVFDQAVSEMADQTDQEAAMKDVLELCKKGMQWHDQFHGHGHWEFHLDSEKFFHLFEAMKVADGIDTKKLREHPEEVDVLHEHELGGEA